MIYNLFKKEIAPTWQEAKLKLITSQSFGENRIGKEYDKAFPPGYKYAYDDEKHFVYEGQLKGAYTILSDFSLYFLNEREQVEKGYRVLGTGEIIEGNTIKKIPVPGEFYKWINGEWIYENEKEIDNINNKIQSIETDLENRQARLDSREKLGMKVSKPDIEITRLLQLHADTYLILSAKTLEGAYRDK